MRPGQTTRRRGPALGWTLFALWLALTVGAFSILARTRMPDMAALDARTAAAATAWIDSLPHRRPGRTMLVRLQAQRCACANAAPWDALAARARGRDVDVIDAADSADAPALPPALRMHELLLVDRLGHPVFLGPVDTGPMCGNRHPVDALLAPLAVGASVSAVVLDVRCDCP